MFLKRVEMQGFKSFADKVVIHFDHSITGVVGPNGCGKSNITDAIRWVLGEQSVKSLRGNTMTDVIFAGSADRRMVNLAEVTLVFDNSKHQLNSDAEEIEVTRRLYRNNAEAEYLINRVPCRLKDIVNLTLDTGLGRDSLSMISQGNISSFAEAKPQERRAIFEEAAGVSKYKKRKLESLSKLERTKDNLDRVQDIVNELERQVTPLKRQARKAEIYREKKERLKEIEIAVLVNDIDHLNQDIEQADKALFELETQTTMQKTTIQVHETAVQQARGKVNKLDFEINHLQDELLKTINEINTLDTRRIELDEKRKYVIEVGNAEEKAKELNSLLEEARMEYENRKNRMNQLNTDIELLSSQLSQAALDLVEATQKSDEASMTLRRLENRREVLENQIKQPFNSQVGVRSIMENKESFKGVLGVVGQSLKAHSGYEEAISVALGGALYNIVTQDDAAARSCIEFLKKNQSGRATFLPLSVLRSRSVSQEHAIICNNTEGYLGVASDFVDCHPVFNPVKASLLQNVLVTDNLLNGNKLAQLLKHAYNIVTLEGDVIHRGGSMTGGKTRNTSSLVTIEKEYKEIKQAIDSKQAEKQLADKALQAAEQKRNSLNNQLVEKRISAAQLEPVVDAKRAKFERLQNDLEQLSVNLDSIKTEDSFQDSLIQKLNENYSKRDEINSSLKVKREERIHTAQEAERKDQQIRQIRKELEQANAKERAIEIDRAGISVKLDEALKRLTEEYQFTFEYAKEKIQAGNYDNAKDEVLQLRNEIAALGNINMNAPEEYSEVNERYEFMIKQMNELLDAREKILTAIDEMDDVMKKLFKEMFDKINAELGDTFRAIFGGGKARLILEDPSDLLNTGIDIDVQPPGKQVQNIRLFSGGEKALIAICVLFSILKARPVPLCIFDEIEAALDQGNVERVARYLKNFKEDTQFIVVTHRPGTMEQCDVLYGVTMQKLGVSQMLKVELKEAVGMAEESEVSK